MDFIPRNDVLPLHIYPHVLLHGPPLSGKKMIIINYFKENNYIFKKPKDIQIDQNNFIYGFESPSLLFYDFKNTFSNEEIIINYIFNSLHSKYILFKAENIPPQTFVGINIHLSTKQLLIGKYIEKYSHIKCIFTTKHLPSVSRNLCHKLQLIKVPNINLFSTSYNISFNSPVRDVVHTCLTNVIPLNIIVYEFMNHYLKLCPHNSHNIVKLANNCYTKLINSNEYFHHAILENLLPTNASTKWPVPPQRSPCLIAAYATW